MSASTTSSVGPRTNPQCPPSLHTTTLRPIESLTNLSWMLCPFKAVTHGLLTFPHVGWVLHSALLVPYHSWRISHGKHHNNTGSCENDEVFAPPTRDDLVDEILLHSPLWNLFQIVVMLTIGEARLWHDPVASARGLRGGVLAGWMPGYLLMNATGPKKYKVSIIIMGLWGLC
jgi:hypothetical protein